MDTKDLKGLMEAYSEVYAPQEVDEALDKRFDSMRKRGGRSAPPEERSVGGEMNRKNKDYWADTLGKGRDRGKGSKAARRVAALKNEELDIFDVVLEFLQVEGFAETLEEAEWMMANVIDEEAIGIILGEANKENKQKKNDAISKIIQKKLHPSVLPSLTYGRRELKKEDYVNEAQHARENPEKYEREQAKKSAPVRGERTPMPPRGDKRREDFEKWYAKQMGR
jgi:hypothetical protein